MPTPTINAEAWYEDFSRYAEDLYPNRYTAAHVRELAEVGSEVLALAEEKNSTIVAHNYQFPELQEVAVKVGDSLGLSQYVADTTSPRVDFLGVWFMGETAKTIVGDRARVFMPDHPGCSLVASIDPQRITKWQESNPGGILVSYVNTDAATKAVSDYVCTSRNAPQILAHAAEHHPDSRILFLPDKFLGAFSLAQNPDIPRDRVDIYDGACHVHAMIGETAMEDAFDAHPDAELLIHPECGCSSVCMSKTAAGEGPYTKAFYLSTSQMISHARASKADEFIVATESGMLYRLRKDVPEKTFHPVSKMAVCEYMKMNTLSKLAQSLREDRIEVVIDAETRRKAMKSIERMLSIQ